MSSTSTAPQNTTNERDVLSTPWPTITLPSYPFTGRISEDFAEHIAGEMSMVHNTLIRSLNALWYHAPLVSGKDVVDFAHYGLIALASLHEHHETEEEIFFPVLEKAGLREMVEGNVAQHKAFHDAMGEVEGYLKGVVENREKYNGEQMRALLKALGDPLVEHLHDEIATIQPETMHKVDKVELAKMYKVLEAHIQSNGTFFVNIPFMITAHNSKEASWPPFPGPLRWLAQNVFWRVNSRYWRFAPYTRFGEPQITEEK